MIVSLALTNRRKISTHQSRLLNEAKISTKQTEDFFEARHTNSSQMNFVLKKAAIAERKVSQIEHQLDHRFIKSQFKTGYEAELNRLIKSSSSLQRIFWQLFQKEESMK